MVTLVKHEWHSTDRQYTYELDADTLGTIYPEMDEDEIANLLQQVENGEADIEDIINEAWNNDVELDWEFQYDDCWTDRKGGYETEWLNRGFIGGCTGLDTRSCRVCSGSSQQQGLKNGQDSVCRIQRA